MDGVRYEKIRWRDSDCYLVKVDLAKRDVRPVMAREDFPMRPQLQPVFDAVEQGALVCTTDGYGIQSWFPLAHGVLDQPRHLLVVDREIWTTGLGGGGFGYVIGDHSATTQRNTPTVQVHVWRPDGSTLEVGAINMGHDDPVVAFTPRGGSNVYPVEGKHYVTLGNAEPWETPGAQQRRMEVLDVAEFTAPAVAPDTVVLEARWPMKLHVGDRVRWVQRLGMSDTTHVVSGYPELLHDGENVVHDLLAIPSHGPDNWFVRKNPRTGLGVTEDGRTAIIAVVQGRTPNTYRPHDHSRGLRLKEFGTFMRENGAHDAVNMDGGGSAFLWMRDGGADLGGTVVAPGCYNRKGTVADGRPGHFTVSVF